MPNRDDAVVPSDEVIRIVVRAHGLGFPARRVAGCLGLSRDQVDRLEEYLPEQGEARDLGRLPDVAVPSPPD